MAELLFLMTMEIWKDIPNYEGYYQVSNLGRVRALPRKGSGHSSDIRILSLVESLGYNTVHLRKDGKGKVVKVHRLVAETFLPNPNGYKCVNHKNRNKLNNRPENLEWCSFAYNINYEHRDTKNKTFRIIQQLDKCGNVVGEFSSIVEASKITGIKDYCISNCVRGTTYTAGGYKWKYNN